MRYKLIAFLAGLAIIFGSAESSSTTSQSSQDGAIVTLTTAINDGDELGVMDILGRVRLIAAKEELADPDFVSFLSDIWYGREAKHLEINWRLANRTTIKAFIAATLVFLDHRKLAEIDEPEFRSFARHLLGTSIDNIVVVHAIQILGLMDDAEDVNILKNAALGDDEMIFRAAVLALAEMCVSGAQDALLELRAAAANPGRQTFIEDQLDAFGGYSRRIRGCE